MLDVFFNTPNHFCVIYLVLDANLISRFSKLFKWPVFNCNNWLLIKFTNFDASNIAFDIIIHESHTTWCWLIRGGECISHIHLKPTTCIHVLQRTRFFFITIEADFADFYIPKRNFLAIACVQNDTQLCCFSLLTTPINQLYPIAPRSAVPVVVCYVTIYL